jgi:carboxypeptidase Taq
MSAEGSNLASENPKYTRLIQLLAEVKTLRGIASALFWDQQVMLPPGGAASRANHMALVSKLQHERFTSPEIGRLLEDLQDYETSLPYGGDEAGTIRIARREYRKATRIPPELVERVSRAGTKGYGDWLAAREAKDYKLFRPALEEIVAVMREVCEAIGYQDHPMDVLLDQLEPGLKIADVEPLFAELRASLVPLAKTIAAKAGSVDNSILHQPFDHDRQLALGREAVKTVGYDLERRGRMDLSVHPYTIDIDLDDVRITTRVKEGYLAQSFFACLHEAGHGLYVQGLPGRLNLSLLGEGASAGIHESQSRLWENVVGRSREFWQFFFPRLKAHFPAQFASATPESIYRAVNKVMPSLIRVEADEVTYNLHIMIRFELEKAVFDKTVEIKDLAEAWNAKFQDYLGLTPPDDLTGVLQDIHWSSAFGAAFTSYTIGNVASIQFYQEALKAHPDLSERFTRGDFAALRDWMRDNVHVHAAKLTPQELMRQVTGQPLTAGPYLAYIRRKFEDLYGK